MSRRRRPEKREILPDPKFKDQILTKFISNSKMDEETKVESRLLSNLVFFWQNSVAIPTQFVNG